MEAIISPIGLIISFVAAVDCLVVTENEPSSGIRTSEIKPYLMKQDVFFKRYRFSVRIRPPPLSFKVFCS